MEESAIRRIVQDELRKAGVDEYQTLIGANWAGNNIRTDDTLSGAAGAHENDSLFPYSIRYPRPSDQVIIQPFGNDKVAAGKPDSLHAGLPASGGYWFFPEQHPEVETTVTTLSRAYRRDCQVPIHFTKAQIEVTTFQAASNATVKVFSSNGVELWSSGNIATTSNGFKVSDPASSNPVAGLQLNLGWFYVVQYSNSVSGVVVRAGTLSATADNALNNAMTQIGTTAANVVAGTPGTVPEFPMILFFT